MHVFGDVLAGGKLLATLFAELVQAALCGQPDRRTLQERLRTRLKLFQLLTQRHALFAGIRYGIGQGRNTRFQLLVQGLKLVEIVIFTLTLAEFRQQTLGFLLFTQTLFQLVQAHAQRLHLFGQMALIDAVAQQLTGNVPRFVTRQRTVNRHHQLVRLLKLAVRRLRHAHFLIERKQFLSGFLLFGLEGIQPFVSAFRGQVRQMAQLFGTLQRLQRLVVLNRTRLLHVKRLLVVSELAFQLIHFQLGGFRAGFVLFLQFGSFGHHFILLFKTNLQLIKIGFVALDFFLLTQRGLHQIQMIAGRLVIGFQIPFRTIVLAQFARHFDMLILLGHQLFAGGKQLAAILQRLIEMNTALVGVAHIVRRHVVGGFADQVFKQVPVRLRNANRFQRHAVFTQRGFHILEGLTHAAVFRQQVVAQGAGNGAGDTAVQGGFNQTVVFTTI